jgi:hypothetical protein
MRTPTQRNYDPHRYIFRNKKSRAKASGVDFSITFEEITFPTHCPVFGVLIDYSLSKGGICNDHSPSFDRIDPNKGYVSGNVIVVSNLANRIKTNATVEQLERVASFYRQLIPHVGANDA